MSAGKIRHSASATLGFQEASSGHHAITLACVDAKLEIVTLASLPDTCSIHGFSMPACLSFLSPGGCIRVNGFESHGGGQGCRHAPAG